MGSLIEPFSGELGQKLLVPRAFKGAPLILQLIELHIVKLPVQINAILSGHLAFDVFHECPVALPLFLRDHLIVLRSSLHRWGLILWQGQNKLMILPHLINS